MASFTLEPRGPFTLASAARFIAAGRPGRAHVDDDEVRLSFLVDDWSGPAHRRPARRTASVVHGTVEADNEARAIEQAARIVSLDHDGTRLPGGRRARPDRGRAAAAAAATCARCSSTRPTRPPPGRSSPPAPSHAQAVKLRDALRRRIVPGAARSCSQLRAPKVCLRTSSRACTASRRRRWRAGSTASRCSPRTATSAYTQLQELPGIGPFYAGLILIRAVGPTDARAQGRAAPGEGGPGALRPAARDGQPRRWRPFRTWVSVLMRAAA